MPSDDEIREILRNPGLSTWLRVALDAALDRDPVDAANDAAVLALILDKRAKEIAAAALAEHEISRAMRRK